MVKVGPVIAVGPITAFTSVLAYCHPHFRAALCLMAYTRHATARNAAVVRTTQQSILYAK